MQYIIHCLIEVSLCCHRTLSKLTNMFSTTKIQTMIHTAGDFYLDLLDCQTVNLIYQNSMKLVVNKSTRVTRKTATEVEHFITNCPFNSNLKKKKKKKKGICFRSFSYKFLFGVKKFITL